MRGQAGKAELLFAKHVNVKDYIITDENLKTIVRVHTRLILSLHTGSPHIWLEYE